MASALTNFATLSTFIAAELKAQPPTDAQNLAMWEKLPPDTREFFTKVAKLQQAADERRALAQFEAELKSKEQPPQVPSANEWKKHARELWKALDAQKKKEYQEKAPLAKKGGKRKAAKSGDEAQKHHKGEDSDAPAPSLAIATLPWASTTADTPFSFNTSV
jgi:hypothetical protein